MQKTESIQVQKIKESRFEPSKLDDPGFGKIFSDHMLEMEYQDGSWRQPCIKPYGPIEVTPALNTFHYGQAVFEGTKAYQVDKDTVHLFRLRMNYERMANSCRRLAIPVIPQEVFMNGVRQLVQLDSRWIPPSDGGSLYIRPFVCGWDPVISAQWAESYRFYIITSPVGSYYTRPVKLISSEQYVRAAKGGVGEAKTAGNYAASFYPAHKAKEMGYDQVLWLDAVEHKYVEEVGTMNIFFIIDDVLITPPLGGTILPGVTRDSILNLAQSWDMTVEERRISIDEVMNAGKNGTLQEVFGAGTAAVISPVQTIRHRDDQVSIHEGGRGPVGQKFYDTLYGIQTGKVEDSFGWVTAISVGEQ
jgi:branched-chain amino acid aminotransferase